MSKETKGVIIAGPKARVANSMDRQCSRCGGTVKVSPATLRAIASEAKVSGDPLIICVTCFPAWRDELPADEPLEVAPVSDGQLLEIQDYLRRN